ncbi:unnamed protein product [Periconia digitata]|uniref:Uncharacterized protein n=1 Tax=Periconia digitata TaxID=1303443 RepID=A0A9W4UUG9_9PLEO|nr:unnamed protein product [Periconia digitata]
MCIPQSRLLLKHENPCCMFKAHRLRFERRDTEPSVAIAEATNLSRVLFLNVTLRQT